MKSHIVSHYEILDELGRGGMGVVYRGRDLHSTASWHPRRCRRCTPPALFPVRDFTVKRRQAASALNHPNIVTIYDLLSEGETATS
jgi:serine/threonine-protein kinase